MDKEYFIEEMSAFVDQYEKQVAEFVEKHDWNANEEFQGYLNIGWSCAERMVQCSNIPIPKVRKRFINLVNISLNRCFDCLEGKDDDQITN